MKFWLILGVIIALIWHWRINRRPDVERQKRKAPATPPNATDPQALVQCAHCHVHLGQTESVDGLRGRYCSVAHRSLAET